MDKVLKNNYALNKNLSDLLDKIQIISQNNKELVNEIGTLKSEMKRMKLEK